MPFTNVGSNIFVDCSLPEDQKTRNAGRLPSSLKLNNCHPKAVKKLMRQLPTSTLKYALLCYCQPATGPPSVKFNNQFSVIIFRAFSAKRTMFLPSLSILAIHRRSDFCFLYFAILWRSLNGDMVKPYRQCD
jgi:hypothetical protein